MERLSISGLFFLILLISSGAVFAQPNGSVTQGAGTTTIADLMPNCPSNHITPLGTIISTDGQMWVVPAENNFQTAVKCADLYNSCNGITPANLAAANLSNVPVVEIDPDGEVITGFLFADNYFELSVNGVLVGVDPVPFTPFNSCVVKFRVKQPYTIAVKLVDWEENPGLGSEINNGNNFHPGDGGFIAQFSDGTVTDASWKAQTFYIAPIQDLNAVVEMPDGTHSTAGATITPTCDANCYGVHYPIPGNWSAANFDETGWVTATLYTATQVTNQAAFKNFETTAWANARFIWTSNLILDNVVLVRKTVGTSASNEVFAETSFEVFPNPASGFFNIKTVVAESRERKVEVLNLDGRLIHTMVLATGETSMRVDLDGLPSGIYIVRLLDETSLFTQKVIVQ